MPDLHFTAEEAPRLLRALASHDAELYDRACAAVRGLEPRESLEPRDPDAVHLLRAER